MGWSPRPTRKKFNWPNSKTRKMWFSCLILAFSPYPLLFYVQCYFILFFLFDFDFFVPSITWRHNNLSETLKMLLHWKSDSLRRHIFSLSSISWRWYWLSAVKCTPGGSFVLSLSLIRFELKCLITVTFVRNWNGGKCFSDAIISLSPHHLFLRKRSTIVV